MKREAYLPVLASEAVGNGRSGGFAAPEAAQVAAPAVARGQGGVDDTLPEVLLRRWRVILVVLLLGWAAGGAYLWFTPASFESTARVVVPGGKRGEDPQGGALARVHPKVFAELMQTRAVLAAAAADPKAAATGTLAGREDPAAYLSKRLEVDTDAEEGLVELTLTTHDPQESATLANAVAAAFWRRYLETRGVTVTQGFAAMDAGAGPMLLDPNATGEGEASGSTAAAGESGEGNVEPDPAAGALARSRVERLASERQEAWLAARRLDRLGDAADAAGADVGQLEGLAQSAELRVEPDRAATDLERRVASTAEAVRQVEGGVGVRHPMLLDLREQMAGLEADLAGRRAARAEALRRAIAERRRHAMARLTEAESELDAARASLLATQRAEASRAPAPMLLLEPAEAATSPSWPKPVPVMALASVAGLVLGSMLAFGKDAWSQRRSSAAVGGASEADYLRQMPAVARLLDEGGRGVPLLGVVPEIEGVDNAGGGGGEDLSALAVHELRAMLQMRVRQDGGFAYAVTSPARGTGKTSIAVAVASSLAASGTRTLLVDSDLTARLTRRGGSAAVLEAAGGGEGSGGGGRGGGGGGGGRAALPRAGERIRGGVLAESTGVGVGDVPVIGGEAGVAAALGGRSLESSTVATQEPNLHLLPVVSVEARDVAKMSSAFVRRLIKEARDDYDLVLFDTGPVPGSAEALLVCGEVDGVVLVGSPRTEQTALNRTLSYLGVCGARVIGTVLNGAAPHHAAPDREHIGRGHRTARDGDTGYADVGGGSGLLAAAMYSAGGTDATPVADAPDHDDPPMPRNAAEITPYFDDEDEAVK